MATNMTTTQEIVRPYNNIGDLNYRNKPLGILYQKMIARISRNLLQDYRHIDDFDNQPIVIVAPYAQEYPSLLLFKPNSESVETIRLPNQTLAKVSPITEADIEPLQDIIDKLRGEAIATTAWILACSDHFPGKYTDDGLPLTMLSQMFPVLATQESLPAKSSQDR